MRCALLKFAIHLLDIQFRPATLTIVHLLTRTGIITTHIGQTLTFASALTRYVYYVVYLYSKRIILPTPMENWKRAILKTALCMCCFLMDIDTSERIKRRVTKMIPELRDLSC